MQINVFTASSGRNLSVWGENVRSPERWSKGERLRAWGSVGLLTKPTSHRRWHHGATGESHQEVWSVKRCRVFRSITQTHTHTLFRRKLCPFVDLKHKHIHRLWGGDGRGLTFQTLLSVSAESCYQTNPHTVCYNTQTHTHTLIF